MDQGANTHLQYLVSIGHSQRLLVTPCQVYQAFRPHKIQMASLNAAQVMEAPRMEDHLRILSGKEICNLYGHLDWKMTNP